MNPEVKQKWVEALRSGKYKQIRGKLKQDGAFCAIGVLCDISNIGTWRSSANNEEDYILGEGDIFDVTDVPVINEIEEWAQVDIEVTDTIMYLNDTILLSFNDIAAYVEKNL